MAIDPHPDLWRDAPAPHPGLQACVVLPVRDEQDRLLQSLQALSRQCDTAGRPLPAQSHEWLVLVNNSSDRSLALARGFAAEHPELAIHVAAIELPPADAHIGHVRRLLMDAAWTRLQRVAHPLRCIASTDSDSRVAPDWLACTSAEIARGADAVGGRILIDPADPVPAPVLRQARLDLAWRLAELKLQSLLDPDPADPWPRHHQHFCASLAVTPAAYARVGGLPSVRFLEDEALVSALLACGLKVRHSPTVQVRTSGRADGRVEVGLSWQLREWGRTEPGPAAGRPLRQAIDDLRARIDAAAATAATATAAAAGR